jgi:hypothetical protein
MVSLPIGRVYWAARIAITYLKMLGARAVHGTRRVFVLGFCISLG